LSILHKKCEIIYNNSTQIYSYNRENVNVIKLKQTIDPETVVFKYKGNTITNATQIRDFGDFYRVILSDKKEISCKYDDVQISQNCISNGKSKELFQYFKDTAAAIGLKTESGINILSNKYNKITAVEDNTVLGKFIDPVLYFEKAGHTSNLIFPFGLNQSQKKAVENAFSSQISIIQGPPGTGKTQTILNIIVNAVLNKKSVAVVSNNNSATSNIAEKMKKHGLSFITAFLGNLENKICFLQTQSSVYPDMQSWTMEKDEKRKLHENVTFLSEELNIMLNSRNRIAEIDHELLSLKPEQFYFKEYYDNKQKNIINLQQLSKLTSKKLISLWLEYEQNSGNKVGLLKKLMIAIRFNRASIGLFSHIPQDAIPYIQNIYYKNKISELQEEKRSLEIKLNDYKIDDKMKELENKSMQLFKAELACRYKWNKPRQTFLKTERLDRELSKSANLLEELLY